MIEYSETKVGDILKLVSPGAGTYASIGELLRVTKVYKEAVTVEDRNGDPCQFVFNCGAARLEPTEWKDDFPSQASGYSEMWWRVYGFFPGLKKEGGEPQMTALVGVYETRKKAEEKRDVENQCWSDEGLVFNATDKLLVTDSTYEELCERVAK